MRVLPSSLAVLSLGLRALAADLDATTPIVEFIAPPDNKSLATCSNASFIWLTRLAPQSADASAFFTLQLVPVASGTHTTTISIPGPQPTSISVSVSATSSGTPGRRTRRQDSSDGQPITLRAGLLARQGAFAVRTLQAPTGWYIVNGTQTPDAGIVFLPSQPFFVAQGTSTACLDSPASATATSTPAAAPDGGERVHVSAARQNAGVIAGAVVGGFVLTALVLGAFFYMRMRRRNDVERWRDARTAQWNAFAAPASSTGHGHDDKAPSASAEDRERDTKAREIAEMLRKAGIREGNKPSELPKEQFELPGLSPRRKAHDFDTMNT